MDNKLRSILDRHAVNVLREIKEGFEAEPGEERIGYSEDQAIADIKASFLEIVGEDEPGHDRCYSDCSYCDGQVRNQLRAEIRSRLEDKS